MTANDPPRKGLGRGLSALLGAPAAAPPPAPVQTTGAPRAASFIPIAQIEPGRYQPRRVFDPDEIEALAESIRAQGILL